MERNNMSSSTGSWITIMTIVISCLLFTHGMAQQDAGVRNHTTASSRYPTTHILRPWTANRTTAQPTSKAPTDAGVRNHTTASSRYPTTHILRPWTANRTTAQPTSKAPTECTEYASLGMEDGSIINAQITASSVYPGQGTLYAWKGRLNTDDYWATVTGNPSDPWIQVDLFNIIDVAGIKTQGSAHSHQEWVTALKIQTGESENTLTYIMEDNEPKIFAANTDKDTAVDIFFPEPVRTRYLRIRPTEWHSWCSLRFEVIVCESANCYRPCLNGGICTAHNTCTCDTEYFGTYCQHQAVYIGCFGDVGRDRAIPDHTVIRNNTIMTNEWCIEYCLSLPIQYRYVATQNHRTCRCGLDEVQHDRHGEYENECTQECRGSGVLNNNMCGGPWRNTIWEIKRNVERCPANVTQMADGLLTWPQTTAGEVAFSEEKCNSSTVQAGCSLAVRYCKASTGLNRQPEWGSVQYRGCFKREQDTAQCETVTTQSYGRRRLQNSYFEFLDSDIADGVTYFSIGIQGSVNAYIILSPSRNPSDDNRGDAGIPKIIIGGWNNEYSGVICNSNQDSNADISNRHSTPQVLSSSEMRYFTISWANNQIQVTKVGSSSPLFIHPLRCPVTVKYIGMSTGWSTSASIEWTTCFSASISGIEYCLPGETHSKDGPLNWMKTPAGQSTFSIEKCPENTPRAGWPVAARYCNPSDEIVQWDDVKMLGCLEDVTLEYKATGYCPPEWDPHGSYCYYVNTEDKGSFSEAEVSCRHLGGNLTSIHSLEEQTFHSVLVRESGEPLWIGLHDVNNEGSFEWIDGTPLNFESWSSGQPDDWVRVGGEDCGHLYTNGQWNDKPCSGSMGFICKQPRGASDGFCPPDETYSAIGVMTWQETVIGNTAFSDETCGANTDNSGRSIGVRYCERVSEECTNHVNDQVFRVCPENWVGFDQFCYYLNKEPMSFVEAEADCQQRGGNITSIHNAGEQAFIQEFSDEVNSGIRIGLHDQVNERTFVWVDNTPLDYKNWNRREPNDYGSGEDCVLMFTGSSPAKGWWNDYPCDRERPFVCKRTGSCTLRLGMASGIIKDGQITASSTWDSNHGPARARLNQSREGLLRGAWTAASSAHNRDQWIQVDFARITTVTAVILQGRADEDQWVRNYKVEYTQDGSLWLYVLGANRQARVFNGNTDRNTPVVSELPQAIQVMALRIRPTAWHIYISMRFELAGCEDRKDTCLASSKFGWSIVNRRLKDSNDWTFVVPGKEIPCDGVITHWHYWGKVSRPFRAIVWKKVEGHQTTFDIVGINNIPAATQANQVVDYAVPVFERFQVHRGDVLGFAFRESLIPYESSTSRPTDEVPVRWYRNNNPNGLRSGARATFTGSGNRAYSLSATVAPSEQAIHSECATHKGEWGSAEIIPCNNIIQEYLPVMCREPLGLEDGTIKNAQITASSSWDNNHAPWQARLNNLPQGQYQGCWIPRPSDQSQWIQVDLLHRQSVSGVVLQGRDATTYGAQYVTKFKVQYGQNGFKWNYVKDTNNNEEVFDGNTDTSTPVTRYFHTPVAARFVRIRPWEYKLHMSLRFELLGCKDCLLGWDANGDHCYYVSSDQITFADAQSECERMDSNLTSIHTADEQVYHAFSAETANEHLWIGLHDRTNGRRFTWIDGSRTDDFEPQWAPYQPDNVGQEGGDCAHLRIDGLWNDKQCTYRAGYICKTAKKRREGMCPAMLTSLDTETRQYLTFGNVLAGEIGFSDEMCPDDSHNVGLPLATRFCRPSSEWGNVELLNCYDEIGSTALAPISVQSGCQEYQTPNDPNVYDHHYYWPQIPSDVTRFTFKVRASNDVRISLSSEYRDVENMYKIVLGGWGNTKSFIRSCKDCRGKPFPGPVSTPAILSSEEYRDFYVSFDNGNIRIGRLGEDPSVTFQSDAIHDVRYVGIGTGRGSTGDWMFCGFDGGAIVDCPMGWELNGDYCYYVVMDRVTFYQAENECENMGSAKLTSIHSEQEQLYHTSLAARAGIFLWLGLHDRSNEGNFVWVDETPYGTYEHWASNQPDNHGLIIGEDCVHMRSGDDAGLWNDLPCTATAGYVCKQPKTPTCLNEQTNSDYGILNWSKTNVGDATFSDAVCPNSTKHSGSPIAFRRCSRDDFAASTVTQGTWLPVKILGCHTVNSTDPQLTDSDAEAVSRKLSHFTQTMGIANAKDVHAVAWMVRNIASVKSSSVGVLESMTQAVSRLVEAVDTSLRIKHESDLSTSTSDVVRALEKQVDQTMQQQDKIQILESSVIVLGVKLYSDEISSVNFASYETGLEDNKFKFTGTSLTNMMNDTDLLDDQSTAAASIQIPLGAYPLNTESRNVTASFISYSDDFLFRSRRLESQMLKVDGPIVATTMTASNLSDPVVIRIKGRSKGNTVQSNDVLLKDESATESIRRCVFWDFQLEQGVGDWSEQGCKFVEIIEGVTTCRCTHLSTFAVLRDVSDLIESAEIKTKSLLVIPAGTKLAVALSLIAVAMTLSVFVGSKRIRNSKSYHTICNFCGAVFALYIVFAAGIDSTNSSTGCFLVAVLLHYFTLVSLLWLAVDIRFTFTDSKAHAAAESSHIQPRALIKAYVVAWGIPVTVVAATMGISFDDYKNSKYCAFSVGPALFYGAAIPLTVFVLHNIVTFVCAVCAMKNPKPKGGMNTSDNPKVRSSSQRLWATLVVSIVFTISLCLMYLFLADPSNATTRVLFGVSVVSLGFVTLGMYCYHLRDVRDVVSPKMCFGRHSEIPAHSFGNPGYTPEDVNDHMPFETIEIADATTEE